jgi:nitrite reductase (cytochrome c-552)
MRRWWWATWARRPTPQFGRDRPVIARGSDYRRRAQFFADFVEAENSMGFHADQEAARILARSIDYSRRG